MCCGWCSFLGAGYKRDGLAAWIFPGEREVFVLLDSAPQRATRGTRNEADRPELQGIPSQFPETGETFWGHKTRTQSSGERRWSVAEKLFALRTGLSQSMRDAPLIPIERPCRCSLSEFPFIR
jgi:hypothetical protein